MTTYEEMLEQAVYETPVEPAGVSLAAAEYFRGYVSRNPLVPALADPEALMATGFAVGITFSRMYPLEVAPPDTVHIGGETAVGVRMSLLLCKDGTAMINVLAAPGEPGPDFPFLISCARKALQQYEDDLLGPTAFRPPSKD